MSSVHSEKHDAQVFRFDQSGGLLRKVMESAAVGMALVGLDQRIIYANPAFEQMLGYPLGGTLGVPCEDMLDESDRAVALLHLGRLIAGEAEDFKLECRARHRDGEPIWILASAALLRSEITGRPLYTIVQTIDIERQKRAEAALAKSESRWNFALESARHGVWDFDVVTGEMFYSRVWRRMRGIGDHEYVDPAQDKWLARVHPDDVPHIKAALATRDANKDGYIEFEFRERHRDGHWLWLYSRGKVVEVDGAGNALRVVGTDTDISARKAAEAALAEEKERLRVTLEAIADGVISTDAEGKITFMNPVAETMTGWTENVALGRPVSEVFVIKSEATGLPGTDPVAVALEAGKLCRIQDDIVLAARNGTGYGVSGSAAPVRTEEGHIIGAVLVFKDATEAQEAQRRLTHSAYHDALTRLPNRTSFASALSEACRQAEVEKRTHALCFIDLDRFKPVNDNSGHAAGDALLQKVAAVIRRSCRSNDFAARLGGDEFVLLLADCPLANAALLAQKIVEQIASIEFSWEGADYRIGASIGVTAVTGEAGRDFLAEADAACYAAKANGRGGVSVAQRPA